MLTYLLIAIGLLIVVTVYIIWQDTKRRRDEEHRRKERKRTKRIEPHVYTRPRPKTEPIATPETQEPPKSPAPKQPSRPKKPTPQSTVPPKENVSVTKQPTKKKKEAETPQPTSEARETTQTPIPLHRRRFTWQIDTPPALPRPHYPQPVTETTEAIELPEGNYPPFSHQRLIDMGLSDAEAKAFVQELIPQIEEQIPQIEAALHEEDFHKMERLTHSIKGSSTNVGSGGVADVLVDYNVYLKTGDNRSIAARYLEILKTYLAKLKEHYLD